MAPRMVSLFAGDSERAMAAEAPINLSVFRNTSPTLACDGDSDHS